MRSKALWWCALLVGLVLGCDKPTPTLQKTMLESVRVGDNSLFATPHLVFRRQLETEAPYPEGMPGGELVRGKLETFQVLKWGVPLEGKVVWLDEGRTVAFIPAALLPARTNLRLEYRIRYEVFVEGEWVPTQSGGGLMDADSRDFITPDKVEAEQLRPMLSIEGGTQAASPVVAPAATFAQRLEREVVPPASLVPVRAELEELSLYQGETKVAATARVTAEGRAVLEPVELLASQKPFKAVVRARWARKVEGVWSPVQGGESAEVLFTTAAYDTARLHPDNLASAYPQPRQLHFHRSEHPEGHLRLKRLQNALFASTGQHLSVRFFRPSGLAATMPAEYDAANQRVRFLLPFLGNGTIYVLRLVSTEGSTERVLFEAPFSTSRYATFADKWSALTPGAFVSPSKSQGIILLSRNYSGPEYFDAFETQVRGGLVQGEAIWEGNSWYESLVDPLVYSGVRSGTLKLTWERPADLGMPPVRDVYLMRTTRVLTDAEVAADALTPWANDHFTAVTQDVHEFLLRDYNDLRQQALNHPRQNSDPWLQKLASSYYLSYDSSEFWVKLRYVIPGTTQATHEFSVRVR